MRIVKKRVKDFNPHHIFDCGQCFRWNRQVDSSYTGIVGNRVVNMKFEPDKEGSFRGELIISNATEDDFQEFWKAYLDLERDYGAIKMVLSKRDKTIAGAITHGQGIRLLQQDQWETLLSFIISQNNNIPRIKKCIEALCENFGEKIGVYEGQAYYAFPEPEPLSKLTVEDLTPCKLGYRAKYIIDTAKQIVNDGREKLQRMRDSQVSAEEAFTYVSSFSGVGPKVANCILLFSMGKYESFPIDVWVKKVMAELYGLNEDHAINDFAKETFGEHRGIAQQYLFYFMRQNS